MLLHEYETTIIIRPDVDESDVKDIVERFEERLGEAKATLLLRDDWGSRKMAYSIGNHGKGRYVLFNFLSDADAITELERRIRIEDRILRFLTIRVADSPDVPTRIAEAAELRVRKAEEAARRAAEAELRAAQEAEAEAARQSMLPPA